MKIAQLTAGTAVYYCGNCVRDNGLVRGLRKLGHDAVMVPLYLPLYPDEVNTSEGQELFFGGINAYLQQKYNFFQKTPRWIDKLFDSDYLLKKAGAQAGMTKASELGEMTLSSIKGEQGRQVKELRRLVDWLKDLKPEVVSLSNGLLVGFARMIQDELGVPVICNLQGEDGFLDSFPEPFKTESWNEFSVRANECAGCIAVSQYYGGVMKQRLTLPDDKMHVVLNGISLEGYDDHHPKDEARTIGYLARMCHFKGMHSLVDAFIALKKDAEFNDVRLRIAGVVLESDNPYIDEQKQKLIEAGLLDHVDFLPNLSRDEKIRFLKSLTVFSVPAMYGEAFGLYVLESLAAGVPVVQPSHGGFTELLNETGGGLLYEPEEPNGLVDGLRTLLTNAEHAAELSNRGREMVQKRFTFDRMAQDAVAVFERALR